MNKILGILGPTGVGKSRVAVEVCKKLGDAYVISADSMQIYRGMDVGTAKISQKEMDGVPHFAIDVVSPEANFSAYDFCNYVENEVFPNRNGTAVVAGGTGLYFESLIYGLDAPVSERSSQIRKDMQDLLASQGPEAVLEVLKTVDRLTFDKIDKNNLKRVVRAIEIAESGGSMLGKTHERRAKYDYVLIVLNKSRDELYRNADARVDEMVKNGLFEEVEALSKRFSDCGKLQSFQAIGYKEIVQYQKGDLTRQQAVDAIKLNTRHYVKRQLTYFRRMKNALWLDVDGMNCDEVVQKIIDCYENN